MKKIVIVAMVLAATISGAKAQSSIGSISLKPTVGMTIANVTNGDGSSKVGLIAGFEGEYQLTPMFSLSAGALYSMQGSKDGDTKFNSEYINIPILANVYVAQGLALKAGIQPGFLTKAKMHGSDGDVSADVDIKDYCKSVDFSIPVGISYEYQGFVLDARYNIGLTNILDGKTSLGDSDYEYESDSKNSVFAITVGYKFSL